RSPSGACPTLKNWSPAAPPSRPDRQSSSQQRIVELVRERLSGQAFRATRKRAQGDSDVLHASAGGCIESIAPSATGVGKGCHQCGKGLGHSAHATKPLSTLLPILAQCRHSPIA